MKANGVLLIVVLSMVSLSAFANPPETTNAASRKTATGPDHQSGFNYNDASMDKVLAEYSTITGRTILHHPLIRENSPSISIHAPNADEFVEAVEAALRKKDIAMIQDGKMFELVVPASEENRFKSFLHSIPSPAPDNSGGTFAINFKNLSLDKASEMYGKLIGRKLKQGPLPTAFIDLQTEKRLSKAEMVHAFDVLFAFNGIKPVNVGDDSFQFTSISLPGK